MCSRCNKKANSSVPLLCEDDLSVSRFLSAVRLGIKQAKSRGDITTFNGLTAVIQCLPKFPVIAAMESEARGLPAKFTEALRATFHVRAV